MSLRPFALVGSREQWQASLFDATELEEGGRVGLTWKQNAVQDDASGTCDPGGLAFDGECRLYRSIPSEGRVQRMHWSPSQKPEDFQLEAFDLFHASAPIVVGSFVASEKPQPLRDPRALAVDENDRLFVAERGAGCVLVYDLWSSVLVRRVLTASTPPLDVAAYGSLVYVLLDGRDSLLEIAARDRQRRVSLPAELVRPTRIGKSVV